MIPAKIIKQVTELANKEIKKEYHHVHVEEWQTRYILEVYVRELDNIGARDV